MIGSIHSLGTGNFFIRPILYISVICLLNTLFFAIVKRPAQTHEAFTEKKSLYYNSSASVHKTIKLKVAKSLLRLVLENYLAEAPDASDTKENTQEEVHKIEYISHYSTCLFYSPFIGKHVVKPYTQPSLNNPIIDRLTPPPKTIV